MFLGVTMGLGFLISNVFCNVHAAVLHGKFCKKHHSEVLGRAYRQGEEEVQGVGWGAGGGGGGSMPGWRRA